MRAMRIAANRPRQKSCHVCARSKRRCDKRIPSCTRCVEKGLSCVYVNYPSTRSCQPMGGQSSSTVLFPDLDSSSTTTWPSSMELYVDPGIDLERLPDYYRGFQTSKDTLIQDIDVLNSLSPDFDFNNLMNHMSVDQASGSIQMQTSELETARLSSLPPPLDQSVQCFFYEQKAMSDTCANLDPWSIHDPTSRVGFTIATFKEFPALLVREHELPFLHRHLYRSHIPHAALALYSVVTIWTNRTDGNRACAIRSLCEAADELVGMPGRSQGKGKAVIQTLPLETMDLTQSLTPLDKLARTQALLIYQQIRVFDGDITLQAQAERDMGTLETWIEDLETYRDNLAEMCLLEEGTLRGQPPRSWDEWIFAECVRRTILLGYGFISLVSMLKTVGIGGTPVPGRSAAVHRWTASKYLWEAASSDAFMTAWRETRQHIIQNFSIQRLPGSIKVTDTDHMIKLLLTWVLGPK
ncbi:hypothetical protein LCI18_013736 [Fusarium solani-melongenae]|uniref:Uncharacterized protein n=1 Tax=Fusarium solani subsp. cucurbitae TaxID=2747967 RepID=A0ACD3ZPN4_FUSSC|nr:hypothetical protein LCI18_013736 [Fusarium solani-melongenae]